MSTTNPVTGTSSNVPAAGLSNTPANMQINQTDFLQLITAQMKDQNPLSPSDPTQFVTQLEGMSQVSAMQSMQASMQASSIMNGTSLIGHSVLAPGTTANLATGGAIGAAVNAPAGTSQPQRCDPGLDRRNRRHVQRQTGGLRNDLLYLEWRHQRRRDRPGGHLQGVRDRHRRWQVHAGRPDGRQQSGQRPPRPDYQCRGCGDRHG